MNKRAWGIVFLLIIAVLILRPEEEVAEIGDISYKELIQDDYYKDYKKISQSFVMTNLITKEGGVLSYKVTNKQKESGNTILARNQGLYMIYLVSQDKPIEFEKSLRFVMDNLVTPEGLVVWALHTETGEVTRTTDTLASFRIIKALLLAYEKWEDVTYRSRALELEKALYTYLCEEEELLPYYPIEDSDENYNVALCYLDFNTIGALSKYRQEWLQVYDKGKEIISRGYLGEQFPFYESAYNYRGEDYVEDDKIDMLESLITVLNLTQIDAYEKDSIIWLKNALKQGEVYEEYNKQTGIATTTTEDASIYAVTAQIGKSIGDLELYILSIEHLLKFQIQKHVNESLIGAIKNPEEQMIEAEENLWGLLAF